MKTQFKTRSFQELTTTELFSIYKLRAEIFVVEQNCAYQDVDDKDLNAYHIMIFENNELIGYSRAIPPGISYPQASIGRVCVARNRRQQGLGRDLMKYSVQKTMELFAVREIVISAQCYLTVFYEELGFAAEGEEYLEDDIPHIKMRFLLK